MNLFSSLKSLNSIISMNFFINSNSFSHVIKFYYLQLFNINII